MTSVATPPTTDSTASRVWSWLRERQEPLVELLERMARVESPSQDARSQEHVLEILSGELAALGFERRRYNRRHLYARPHSRRKGHPLQLLLGHCDTVWPVGTLETMPLVREDGRLKGPGVYDMKGGLAQLLFALRAIRALELELEVQPLVFVNSDEEIGSRGSTACVRRLARVVDRALILEPSLGPTGKLKTGRKGVGRFVITVKGRAAHAGLAPEQGVSAILELSHVIQQLFALNDPTLGVTVNVGQIQGGLQPNVIAPESRAVVDVRVPSQAEAERVEAAIRGLRPTSPDAKLEVQGVIGRPPMERTPGNEALWALAQGLGGELGLELSDGTAGGGSDGNTTSLYTPTLDGLGAVGDGAHARHEFLFVDKLCERAALLALLLLAPPLAHGKKGS